MLRLTRTWNHKHLGRRLLHITSGLDKLVQFKLSDIGEGIAEVQLKDWHVKVGDHVNEFDEICEVQSDKASVTITSRYQGTIRKLYYAVDEVAKVGTSLIDIEVADDEPVRTTANPDEIPRRDIDKSDSRRKDGPCVPTAPERTPPDPPSATSASDASKFLATPAVRRLIREHAVDIAAVTGSGKEGRVLKEDILKYLGLVERSPAQFNGTPAHQEAALSPAPTASAFTARIAEDKVVPIRGYTRAMVKSMSEALKIPHFGYNDEYAMDELMRLRGVLKAEAKRRQVKLTYLPIIIKATSMALSEFPQLNARADERQENLIYKAHHNICLAMDTPGGLVVPNIKYCEQKSVWEIVADLNRIRDAGQKQHLDKSDLADGTFTLSNIGIIGGTYTSPVIMPPQVAIGALGRIRKLPRFDRDDRVFAAHIMNISWAADHRYVDGATMARFSERLKQYMETPATLMAALR